MAAELMNIDNAIKVLQMTISFTLERIDDWQNVVPEAKSLRKECQLFQSLIGDILDKPYLPIHNILLDVNKTLTDTKKLIEDFLYQDNRKDRSIFSKTGWKMKRVYLAYDHRAVFKAATAHLEVCKKKIEDTLQLSAMVSKPTVHWYRGDMPNHESFLFWKDMCGEEIQANGGAWAIFIQNYQQKYKVDWDDNTIERIRRVACKDGTNMTIAGYILLTKLCDFPLNLEKLPSLMDSHATVSAQTRMEVAKMVNELITYYSSKEMRDLIVSIFTWYKGYNKRDREAWQERANDWGRILKANRGKTTEELDEEGKLVEQVDMARRTYSFFFQRYMVVFKIGQLSKEMFAEVDFPGKARMFEFLEHVRPLDRANYHIVIGGNPKEWESKQPKVYTFLEEYIRNEKAAKKAAAAAAYKKLEDSNDAISSSSKDATLIASAVATTAISTNDAHSHHDSKLEVPSTKSI
ncbi:hypothetical protein BC941DRAFT_516850 [Chlamydoabsidia padenii]|nr:hypothetical protein BC941DRAFT_516850 [Chlamydoabsidia padenii]